jgi:hypothetical protein
VLGHTDEIAERGETTTMIQMYRLMGGNLLDLPHEVIARTPSPFPA